MGPQGPRATKKVRQSAKCPTTVYVKNLAFDVDDAALTKHFERRGGKQMDPRMDSKSRAIRTRLTRFGISFGYSILEKRLETEIYLVT